jgi:hypothetical protein
MIDSIYICEAEEKKKGVQQTSSVATDTARSTGGSKEDDGISEDGDIFEQLGFLIGR